MANYLVLEDGSHLVLEDGTGFVLLEQQVVVAGDYLVQEVDGTSRFTLEDATGFILLEAAVTPTPPTPQGGVVSVRRRLSGRVRRRIDADEDDLIALSLALRTIRRRTVRRDN